MAVRPKDVQQTLTRCYGGVLRAVDRDVAAKLLRAMGMYTGLDELRNTLHAMAGTNQLVIKCEGNRFTLIAIPQALVAEAGNTEEGGAEVPTPRGARKTTYARTGDGKDLPAHLGDKHVGPLHVRYMDSEAGEGIATAAELVFDEIIKGGKCRYGRDELLGAIRGLLLPLYDGKAEAAQTLAMPVLSLWVDNGQAKRVAVPGRGRREEIVIEILPPKAEVCEVAEAAVSVTSDPIELLARLAPELEQARARLKELERRVECAVDPETVARITAKGEELQADKERLQRELEAAGTEKARIIAAHSGQMTKLRTEHRDAQAKLRKEHAAALAELQQKLDAALAEKVELQTAAEQRSLPADLQRRVSKLLGE